jgi:hypothetical protein
MADCVIAFVVLSAPFSIEVSVQAYIGQAQRRIFLKTALRLFKLG